MYQILNSTPRPPSLSHPELPEIIDLIVAKALAKDVEERYASAKDMAKDLRDCEAMVQRRAVSLGSIRDERTGELLPHGAPRRPDKVLAVRSSSTRAADSPADKPAPTLSKAFDSYDATMRLAAMTGAEQELAGLIHAQAAKARENAHSAVKHLPAGAQGTRAAPQTKSSRSNRTLLIWVITILGLLVAVALVASRVEW